MTGRLTVTWRRQLGRSDASDYDRFVDEAAGGHASQTRAWAALTTATRPLAARYVVVRDPARIVGSALVLRPRALGPLVAPVARVERGPVCANVADLARVLQAIVATSRRHGVARLQVMPYWTDGEAADAEAALARTGFRSVQGVDGAHVATLRIDVGGKSDAEILAGKDRETLRRKLRQAEKAGAIVHRGERSDMRTLAKLHDNLMGSQSMEKKPTAWFDALWDHVAHDGARGAVFVCEHDGEAIAALFASRHGALATFVLGASTSTARTFSKMVLPMMAAIRWSRDVGCARFDMGGVPMDGDTDEKRAAIAQFKFDFAKARVRLVREHARWF